MPPAEPKAAQRPVKKRFFTSAWKRKSLFAGMAGFILIVIIAGGVLYLINSHSSPVPSQLTKDVNFPIYYPDPKKLPAGYTLDRGSFTSPAPGVILYAVNYNGGKLIFSIQQKPSASELKSFNTQRIPLHTSLKTKVGEAVIGAIGNQSIVSLPTNSNAWIIVTAPYATDQAKLADVLNVLRSNK